MLVIAIIPLIAAILGLLMWLLCKTNADAKEIGRMLMWCGTLVTLFALAAKTLTIGGS